MVTYCKNHYTHLPDPDPAKEQIFPNRAKFLEVLRMVQGDKRKRFYRGKVQFVGPLRHPIRLASSSQHTLPHLVGTLGYKAGKL